MKAVEFFNKNKDKFHDFFGLSLNKYLVSELLVIDVGSFDIIKFDSEMHDKGYSEDKDGSLSNYVELKYGKSADAFIKALIKE